MSPLWLPADQSHFGYLSRGSLHVVCRGVNFTIQPGFHFSLPGAAELMAMDATDGIVVSRPGYESYLTMGLLEDQGRLRYIDGCTDSLLIPPVKLGDPCLNLLYFPPDTDQTMHTHPSDRIGMILSGQGVCVTQDERGELETPLVPGMIFCIHTGGKHKFRTLDSPMRVLAYHPDTDFGPTDEDHPMINRTMVNGVSAAKLTEIHTGAKVAIRAVPEEVLVKRGPGRPRKQ
jgi:mannose-6-phosphate isomerase-like protein (cupin superfamily)